MGAYTDIGGHIVVQTLNGKVCIQWWADSEGSTHFGGIHLSTERADALLRALAEVRGVPLPAEVGAK